MGNKAFASQDLPIGLLSVDASWHVLFANPQATEYGFSIGDNLVDEIDSEYFLDADTTELIEGNQPFYINSQKQLDIRLLVNLGVIDKSTGARIVTLSPIPIEKDSSSPQYNAFVKNAVDRLPIDVVIYDHNLNFVYINEVAVKDPELRKWLIGKNIGDYVRYRGLPEEHEISRMSFFRSIVDNKKPVTWVDEYYYKDGSEKYMLRNYFPFIKNEEVEFLFGCGVDISKEKLSEKQAKELIKDLTVRNQLLKQFSFVVSHKLRQHSGNLLGLSHLAEYTDDEDIEFKDLIKMIKEVSLELDANLHDLNKIVHMEDEEIVLKELNLKQAILETTNKVLEDLKYEKKFTLNYNSEVSIINVDNLRFNRVLYEILSNSFKYAHAGKELVLNITVTSETKTLKLAFEDNGIGIDLKKYENKLFELYKRFRPDHAEGRGLGMFVLKSQVLSMKGKIDVQSHSGKGTKVTVSLPAEAIVREKDLTISKRI